MNTTVQLAEINDMPELLNSFGCTQAEVYEHIQMPRSSWIRKVKNNSFSFKEVTEILLYLKVNTVVLEQVQTK